MVDLRKQAFTDDDFVRRRRSLLAFELHPDDISRVRVPSLILHARDYAMSEPSVSMKMAQLLSARLTLIDGASVFGDADQGLRAIETFVSELAPHEAASE